MRLSVVLPCYNGAATVGLQLEALARQVWDDWEIVFVDNGSTDGSRAVAESFRTRLPNLRIVQAHTPGTPRLGVPHSYNTGIAAATGDAFVFCEADDEVGEDWLYEMGTALSRHDFVAARLDHRRLNPEWLHPRTGEGYQSERLSRMPGFPFMTHASGCSFGLRRSLYEVVGPLDVAFPCVHDTEYSWRAQLHGYGLQLVTTAVVHYREKQLLAARFRQGRSWGRDYVRLLQRYGAPPVRLPALRRSAWLVRSLPKGLWAAALATLHVADGRHALGQWVWSFGWAWGELLASVGPQEPAQAPVLATAFPPRPQEAPEAAVLARLHADHQQRGQGTGAH